MPSLPITRKYQEMPYDIHKFSGLNIREDSTIVKDTELQECNNYDLGRAGELIKRSGFTITHAGATLGAANQVKILGFFQTDVYAQFIALAGTSLYTSPDGITWTIMPSGPHGAVEYGVQYNNKFYMVRNNSTILKWDGAACTAIAGSPTGTFCYAFKTRLYVLNSLATGSLSSRLTFSELFTVAADFATWPAINFIDVQPGDGDLLIGIANLHDVLVVFKTASTWTLHVQGSTLTWVVRSLNSSVGCISKYTMQSYEGVLLFQGVGGIYETDANSVKQISNSISPAFEGTYVSTSTINKSSAIIWKDKYILMLESFSSAPIWSTLSGNTWISQSTQPWGSVNAVYTYFVYHLRSRGWTVWVPAVLKPQIFVAVNTTSSVRGVYCSDRSSIGKIYKYGDSIYQDNLVSYECSIQTKDTDMDSPVRLKRGKWLAVKQRGIGTHIITHIADGITQASTSIVALDSVKVEYKALGPGFFRMWRLRTAQTSSGALTLFGFTLRMNVAANRTYAETGI